MRRVLIYVFASLLILVLLSLLALRLVRPARTDQTAELFQGVSYTRNVRQFPRPLVVHVVTIDLTAPGLGVLITPGDDNGPLEFSARTTSEFLAEFDLQLAINGSFFKPFHANGLWDYYPHRNDPVNVTGLSISNGVTYSASEIGYPVLCISTDNHAHIDRENCPAGTAQALAGNAILVKQGASVILEQRAYYNNLHPRTAVAVDERGETLWLIIVDGRQANYSEGITLAELAMMAIELGADNALNLDGGGSTTLVTAGLWWPRSLNSPIHTRIPMRQRPVANHLGIYVPSTTP